MWGKVRISPGTASTTGSHADLPELSRDPGCLFEKDRVTVSLKPLAKTNKRDASWVTNEDVSNLELGLCFSRIIFCLYHTVFETADLHIARAVGPSHTHSIPQILLLEFQTLL